MKPDIYTNTSGIDTYQSNINESYLHPPQLYRITEVAVGVEEVSFDHACGLCNSTRYLYFKLMS